VHETLIATLQERDMFHYTWRIGIRRGSLAGLRVDKLFLGENGGLAFFAEVPTKRVIGTPVAPTHQIDNVTFSRWPVHPDDLAMFAERFHEEGWDLMAYLRTRDERFIPWTIARDDTFGPRVRGTRISPLWHSSKGGHYSVSGVTNLMHKIVRVRLEMPRGCTHVMRRRSVIDLDALARLHPQAAEATQHLKAETRPTYYVSEEADPRFMFPDLTSGPTLPSEPAPDANLDRKRRRRPQRSEPKPRMTLDDLIRGAGE
jgi:hypothetical protein